MIVRSVNSNLGATIPLIVYDSQGRQHPIQVVVDTGFNGSLTLPSRIIATLGLIWRNRGQVTLANGATILWGGQPQNVLTEAADTGPLVGMALLHGYDLSMQVIRGGTATIDRLPGTP
jgi:predicted aspartyl protease